MPTAACRRGRARGAAALADTRVVGRLGADDVGAGAVAVVVDGLGHAVAVGVEQLTDVRETVPLGRVLQVQDRQVVADDIGLRLVVDEQSVVHVRPAIAYRGPKHRRMAARVQHVAARVVERQAQAEHAALLDFGNSFANLLRVDQVQSTELVVGAEVAPVRSGRALLPAGGGGHGRSCLLVLGCRRFLRPVPGVSAG
jgi:hypothetical protein